MVGERRTNYVRKNFRRTNSARTCNLQLSTKNGTFQSFADVEVQGQFAYLADLECGVECVGGLDIVDISNPASPVRAGFFSVPGIISRVKISGRIAYLSMNGVEL